jgi:hypothetical protein
MVERLFDEDDAVSPLSGSGCERFSETSRTS